MFTICLVLATAVLVLAFLLYVLQAAWEDVAADLRQQLADEKAKHLPRPVGLLGRLEVGPPVGQVEERLVLETGGAHPVRLRFPSSSRPC